MTQYGVPDRRATPLFGLILALLMANQTSAQAPGANDTLKVVAQFTQAVGDKPARLYVTANIEEGWHIYSLTQPKGGPLPSRIKFPKSDEFKMAGEF
jgi:hypothetical protein